MDAARFFLQAKASSGHEHKEESDDEGEEKKAEEAGAASGSSAEAPAPAPVDADAAGGDDAAGDEDLDAEMLEALGAKKSLPQGIMSEEDMDRMVCGDDAVPCCTTHTSALPSPLPTLTDACAHTATPHTAPICIPPK